MSLNFTQIQAAIHRTCKSTDVSYPIADLTADANLGLAKAWSIVFSSDGKWQWDDSNFTDYPIITTDIVANQRDYAFLTDNSGNLILDIYKVTIKNNDGIYEEIYPVDVQSDEYTESFYDGQDITGIPQAYDKTANGIFFDVVPDYDAEDGLKIYINREGSFFTTTDTNKKPGFAGLFHEYVVLFASYKYASRNGYKNKQDIYNDMIIMENEMRRYYGKREQDVVTQITANQINSV